MKTRERFNTFIGGIQAFVGIFFIITAFLIYHNLYNMGRNFGKYKEISFIFFLLMGIFSVISGFFLSTE